MKTKTSFPDIASVAATVAPEDLRCGDDVAVLNEIREYPSFFWCDDCAPARDSEIVRVVWQSRDGGVPLQVEAICLPFVFVKGIDGDYQSLDVRQVQLVRLQCAYAKLVRKALRRQRHVPPRCPAPTPLR